MTVKELIKKPQILIGHRGYPMMYPENTILSYEEAAKVGVDMIEVDVTVSKDKVVMVSHDDRLDRVSNGTGLVADYTANELKKLDFGSKHGAQFAGEPMPSFADVLDLMDRWPELTMDVDFKVSPTIWETVDLTLKMLEDRNLMERCVFNSCDGAVTKYLARERGLITIGCPHGYEGRANFEDGPDGTYSHLWAVCVPIEDLTPEVAEFYHQKGIALGACSPDTPDQIALTQACKVQLMFCDNPVLFQSMIR